MAINLSDDDAPVSDINVTPMVDVMLVLLIIFMITAPMLMQGVKVNLPQTASAPIAEEKEQLVLTMTADKRFFLGKVEIPAAVLAEKLQANERIRQGGALHLHADKALGYGEVMEVMSILQGAGIKQLGMVTDPLGNAE